MFTDIETEVSEAADHNMREGSPELPDLEVDPACCSEHEEADQEDSELDNVLSKLMVFCHNFVQVVSYYAQT